MNKIVEHPVVSTWIAMAGAALVAAFYQPARDWWLAWLGAEVVLPRWAFLLIFPAVGLAGGAVAYAIVRRRGVTASASAKESAEAQALLAARTAPQVEAPPSKPEPSIPEGFRLNNEQLMMFMRFMRHHPNELDLKQAHEAAHTLTPVHAENELERLVAAGIISERKVNAELSYYKLTRSGRNYGLTLMDSKNIPNPDDDDY